MHEHAGLAAVAFRPQRLEGRIAEAFLGIVAKENHSIEPQCVERIFDFRKSAIDVGKRQRREVAETTGLHGDDIGCVFVDATRHLPSLALVPADDPRGAVSERTRSRSLYVWQKFDLRLAEILPLESRNTLVFNHRIKYKLV